MFMRQRLGFLTPLWRAAPANRRGAYRWHEQAFPPREKSRVRVPPEARASVAQW